VLTYPAVPRPATVLRREGELIYPTDPSPITLETIFDVSPAVEIYPADPRPVILLANVVFND